MRKDDPLFLILKLMARNHICLDDIGIYDTNPCYLHYNKKIFLASINKLDTNLNYTSFDYKVIIGGNVVDGGTMQGEDLQGYLANFFK